MFPFVGLRPPFWVGLFTLLVHLPLLRSTRSKEVSELSLHSRNGPYYQGLLLGGSRVPANIGGTYLI